MSEIMAVKVYILQDVILESADCMLKKAHIIGKKYDLKSDDVKNMIRQTE